MLVMLGYAIDQDPGPVLLVQSSMDAARSFEQPPQAPGGRLPGPGQAQNRGSVRRPVAEMRLDNCSIYLQGAGNPAQLASRPIRYLLADEIDKWPDESKREADALSLAMERVKSFRNHKNHPGLDAHLGQRSYLAGIPGRGPVLALSRAVPALRSLLCAEVEQVKWPDSSDAETVIRETWLECPHCQGRITERHKADMLEAGQWIPENPEAPAESGQLPLVRAVFSMDAMGQPGRQVHPRHQGRQDRRHRTAPQLRQLFPGRTLGGTPDIRQAVRRHRELGRGSGPRRRAPGHRP